MQTNGNPEPAVNGTSQHNAEDEFLYPFPTSFKLREQPIDTVRQLKVDPSNFHTPLRY
jgi:hypothetical protein